MKNFLICLISFLVLANAIRLPAVDSDFNDWRAKYNKNYNSALEFKARYQNFVNSRETVQKLNREAQRRGVSTTYGLTQFADMTAEEFKAYSSGRIPVQVAAPVFAEESVALPQVFDWRSKGAVTPVKNQGQCGSCWAFSATEGVESAWILAKNETKILAPQQVVSCDPNDDGCNGGDLPTAFGYIKEKGQELEKDYPYTSGASGDTGACKYDAAKVVVHISGFAYATKTGNETQMAEASYKHGPLSICVDASTWQYYTGGVIEHGCGNQLDHCVQIVGWGIYQKTIPYWIVRNSWGTDWGIDGYVYVEKGKNECGIADEATYVLI